MSLLWPDLGLAELQSGQLRPGFLMRLGTTPPTRIWCGIGGLTIAADAIELDAPNIYQGVGELLSLPAVSQLINGLAERIEYQLSGDVVTAEVAALARSDADAIRSASVFLGFLIFDRDWQIVSPTTWLWEGIADSLSDTWDGTSGEIQRSISLSVGSVMTGRKRPINSYCTDADQKRRSADDDFFDQINKYEAGATRAWPV